MDMMLPWDFIIDMLERRDRYAPNKVIATLEEQIKLRDLQSAAMKKALEKLTTSDSQPTVE